LEGNQKIGCYDSLATLTASGNFNRYWWSSGDTGRIIKIANDYTYQQTYAVATMDTEGCLSPYSAPTKLYFEQKLDVPTLYVFDQKLSTCTGDSINLIANSNYYNATFYWSNGTTGNNTWVKQTGDYSYYAVTNNGCKTASSAPQHITVFNFPIPPRPTIKIEAGDTLLCEGASITLSAPIGYSLYKWSNGDNVRATTIVPNSSQDISVRVSDSNGCQSAPSVPIHLERLYKPFYRPTITINGGILASSSSKGNQWFLNGNPIAGATAPFYKPTQSGSYTVKFAELGCFSDASDAVQF
jgi:hypothetical protein